jgi:hypothetical protein
MEYEQCWPCKEQDIVLYLVMYLLGVVKEGKSERCEVFSILHLDRSTIFK